MRTIYKYEIPRGSNSPVITMRPGHIIYAGIDLAGNGCIWAEIDPYANIVKKRIFVVGTGREIPELAVRYIGSFNQSPNVWHIYE